MADTDSTTSKAPEWAEPPPSVHGKAKWPEILAPLIDNPGEWAIVRRFKQANGAGALASAIRQGRVSRPQGTNVFDFEAISRTVDGEGRVYVRYVGGRRP
jgi:hypothetical protein